MIGSGANNSSKMFWVRRCLLSGMKLILGGNMKAKMAIR